MGEPEPSDSMDDAQIGAADFKLNEALECDFTKSDSILAVSEKLTQFGGSQGCDA